MRQAWQRSHYSLTYHVGCHLVRTAYECHQSKQSINNKPIELKLFMASHGIWHCSIYMTSHAVYRCLNTHLHFICYDNTGNARTRMHACMLACMHAWVRACMLLWQQCKIFCTKNFCSWIFNSSSNKKLAKFMSAMKKK